MAENKKLIYLATPFTHKLKHIEMQRFEQVTHVAAELISDGKHVFSPITHGVPLVMVRPTLPGNFVFWEDYCLNVLKRCDEMVILTLPEWEKSRGVQAEIEFCKKHNIPYRTLPLMDPTEQGKITL